MATEDDALVDTEVWLDIEKARGLVSVSRRTIYNWIYAGKLKTKRTAGGATRILESSLWREPDSTAPALVSGWPR